MIRKQKTLEYTLCGLVKIFEPENAKVFETVGLILHSREFVCNQARWRKAKVPDFGQAGRGSNPPRVESKKSFEGEALVHGSHDKSQECCGIEE